MFGLNRKFNVLTVSESAKKIGFTPSAVRGFIKSKKLKAFKQISNNSFGFRYLIYKKDLKTFCRRKFGPDFDLR